MDTEDFGGSCGCCDTCTERDMNDCYIQSQLQSLGTLTLVLQGTTRRNLSFLIDTMTTGGILNIAEINALPVEQFEWLFGNVVEHCPEAARVVVSKRPFVNTEALKQFFDEYLENLDNNGKETVLIRHPDLAGKLAEVGKLTQESSNEQKSAGLDALTKEEKQTLNNYNYLYKEKFQFPFVICARRNKVAAILEGMEKRLKNTRTKELNTGINEVKKICRLRIDDLVWPEV